jgi:hypothetical protein
MSDQRDDDIVLGFFIVFFVLALVFGLVSLLGWEGVILVCIFAFCYKAYSLYQNSERGQERRSQKHTHELYERILVENTEAPDRIEFVKRVYQYFPDGLPDCLHETMVLAVAYIYDDELFDTAIPKPPPVCNSIDGARYRDFLSEYGRKLANPVAIEIAIRIIVESYRAFLSHMNEVRDTKDALFTVPVTDHMDNIGEAIEALVLPFYKDEAKQNGLFTELRNQLNANLHEASGIPNTIANREHPDLILPGKYEDENPVNAYLKGTPFVDFFNAGVAFDIPHDKRFEHHWIIAPPGTGKSNMLQNLLLNDFKRVARNEASIVVIDTNRDLATSIEKLKIFGKGGQLEDRLIYIDVEDVEFPVSINLFDVPTSDDKSLSPRDREILYNSAVSMLSYIFYSLLGTQLTSRQNTLFSFTIELLLTLPNASLDTLIELMQPDGFEKYAHHIKKLSADAQNFFETKFSADSKDKDTERTKAQILDRLFAIKGMRALSRIFSSPKTKLDLYKELSQSKVIVINAAKTVLKEEGTELFTRYILAMVMMAVEKRQLIPKSERLDTFLYIDECQDVIRRDVYLPVILDQARKLRLGCIVAHQRLGQMEPHVLNALYGSTAIKFASNLTDANLSTMANSMHTTTKFLQNQPPHHFAAFISGTTETAVSIKAPHVDFSTMEQMTDEEYTAFRDEMRKRYTTYQAYDEHEKSEGKDEGKHGEKLGITDNGKKEMIVKQHDQDNPDTSTSSEW